MTIRCSKVSGAIQAALMNTLHVLPEDFYQNFFTVSTEQVSGENFPSNSLKATGLACVECGGSADGSVLQQHDRVAVARVVAEPPEQGNEPPPAVI